jgi:hypothetical protein
MPNMPAMDKEPEVDPMRGETKPRRTPSGRFKRARTSATSRRKNGGRGARKTARSRGRASAGRRGKK